MKDDRIISIIHTFLSVNKNLSPIRIQSINEKNPDFKVEYDDGGLFYCEVKSPKLILDEKTNCFKHSTTMSKLCDLLHKATKQFASVNGSHLVPNVLIWTSENFQLNWSNFVNTFNGFISVDSTVIRDFRKSEFYKKVVNDWKNIDYHIWLQIDTDGKIYEEKHFIKNKIIIAPILINRLGNNIVRI